MIGIVLISHGEMAAGILNSCGMFFGEDGLSQVVALGLQPQDSPEVFDEKLAKAIAEVDSGDGVIIFADLLGGTPCNRSAMVLKKNVQVITGMNLPVVMEALGLRQGSNDIDVDGLINTAREGIASLNQLMKGVGDVE
ncbi:MAG: PTS sugar transporter subunit IIA [Erysipelotrichaceae bacterium]|jgi:mannose/fructose/sorbose-specific phosphotransferase system IIA component|nr:PTS sugar transporter subunit IIA [Erysipelotrichaceae bacterium]